MQPRKYAHKERDNVTAARDPGRVAAVQYCRLATSLRSLAILFPIHLHILSLVSTLATVFLELPYVYVSGQTQAYVPIQSFRCRFFFVFLVSGGDEG